MEHRRFFICANWKMDRETKETDDGGEKETIDNVMKILNEGAMDVQTETVISVPAHYLQHVKDQLTTKVRLALCVRHCCQGHGYFSPAKIKESGAEWVLLGHLDGRLHCGETDQEIGHKVQEALHEDLKVIACVGDTLQQRAMQQTEEVVFKQLSSIAQNVTDWRRVVLAYEPGWALGTGKRASSEEIQAVHRAIREWLAREVADNVDIHTRIIYGGPVTGNNCRDLAGRAHVDGFLVGPLSSLSPDFVRIVNARK